MVKATLELATRPFLEGPGLLTYKFDCPVFAWTETLTHRRFARNASSSRAQSVKRHHGHGYYTPPEFHEQGVFMQGGQALPQELQEVIGLRWKLLHDHIYAETAEMDKIVRQAGYKGLAKEEVNRPLPTTKMITGVVTGTESAWWSFLALRYNEAADPAMQEIARQVGEQIRSVKWVYSLYHVPFWPGTPMSEQDYLDAARVASARAARVSSGAPGPGQRSDDDLADDLMSKRHASPFEHSARFVIDPAQSCYTTKASRDLVHLANQPPLGWQSYRAELEMEGLL